MSDVKLAPEHVAVADFDGWHQADRRATTLSSQDGGLPGRDIDLALKISAVAAALHLGGSAIAGGDDIRGE